MGYDALVKNNVRKAFNLIGDLKEIVTLTLKKSTAYNFSTAQPAFTAPTTKDVQGLFIQKKGRDGSLECQFMLKAEDLDSPDLYDKLTRTNGEVWSLVQPFVNDGYIITINLAKVT